VLLLDFIHQYRRKAPSFLRPELKRSVLHPSEHYPRHCPSSFGVPAYLSMRLNPASVENGDELPRIIYDVRTEVTRIDPSVTFQYSFMDEEFDNTFREEKKMSAVLNMLPCWRS
jgi:hypothetical protein